MARLRDRLQSRLGEAIPGLSLNGSLVHRLPNTLHLSLPVGSARAVIAMLANEVALSPGAACHADGEHVPSGVIRAIGATAQQANGTIRISLGYSSTDDEIDAAARPIAAAYAQHVVTLGEKEA